MKMESLKAIMFLLIIASVAYSADIGLISASERISAPINNSISTRLHAVNLRYNNSNEMKMQDDGVETFTMTTSLTDENADVDLKDVLEVAKNPSPADQTTATKLYATALIGNKSVPLDFCLDKNSPMVLYGNKTINISGNVVFPPAFVLGELPEPACIVIKLKDITYLDLSSDVVASKMIDVSERNINRTYSYSFNAPKPIKSHLNRTYILTAVLNIGWCHSKDSDEWIRKGDFLSIKRHVIKINDEQDSYQKDIQVVCYACDRIHLNTLQYASNKLRTSIMEAKQPQEKTNVIPEMSDEIINVAGEIVFPKPVYVIPPNSCVIVKLKDVSFQDSSSNILASKVFPVSGENVRSIEYSLNSKKPTEENLNRVTVLTAVVNMGWCKSEQSDDWLKEGDYLSVMRHRISLSSDEDAYTMNINVVCYFCKEKKKRGLQILPPPTGEPIKITRIPSGLVDKMVVPREEDSLPSSNFSDRIEMNITGRISLPNELGVLPNESCLLIKMKDVSIMDGPSYVLASSTVDMTGTYVNQSIDYLLRSPKPPVEYSNRVYSISSVLNVGWCKNDTSSEWIRKGDFLSVKRHLIKFDYAKDSYETDIELICYACNDDLEFTTDPSVTSWISNLTTTVIPPIVIPTDNTLVVEMSNKTVNITGNVNFPFPLHLIPTPSCMTIKLQDVTMMDVSANVLATTKIDISEMNITGAINYVMESLKPNVDHLHRGRIYTLQAVVNMGWCKDSNSQKWIRGGDFMSAFSERVFLNEADDDYNADINVTCYSCGTKYIKPTLIPAADDAEEYEPTAEEEVTLLSVSPVKMSGDVITVDGEINFPDEEIKFPDGSCMVIKLKDVSLADAFSDVLTVQVRYIGGREVFKSLEFTFKSQKPAVDFLNREYALTAVINIGWCSDGSTTINGTKSSEWIRKGDYVSVERHTIIFEENRFEYGHNIKVVCYDCTKIKEPARIPLTTPTTQQNSKTKRPRKKSSNVLPPSYEKLMKSKVYRGDKGEDGNLGLLGNTGPPGLPGPAGYPGPDGEFGNLGPPGYKGRRGVRGIDGLSGFRNGPKGLRGERGPPGGYGPQGVRGFKGYKGQSGEHGPPGVPGQMGNHGEGGEHGPPGARGFAGKKGAEGKMGFQGPKGKFGPPGPPGKLGAQGLQGEAGDDGPTGIKGYLGALGHMGFTGEDGNPGTLGPKGPAGAPGLQGDPGYPGSPGKFGGRGINGEPGERGENGIPGAKGDNGFDGGIGEIGKVGDLGLRGLRGLPGELGPQGRRGPKGGKGAKGFIGMRGYKGIPGTAGEHGVPGVQGDKGEAGTPGEKGPQGVKGTKGAGGDAGKEGAAGKRGVPGPVGEHGNDGMNGEKGLRGDPGDTGPIGEKGNRGPVGKPGPMGIKGRKGGRGVIGGRGDIGAKGEEGYPGHPGEPGERGHYGQQGLKGPTGEDGEVGQTGPLGAKGEAGSAGKPGRTGQQGFRGHRGTSGLEGFEGLKGEPGRKGTKGPPGPTGPAGAPGEVGVDGVGGESGKSGSPGTMGPDGKPGLQGRPGKVGKPGSIGPKGDAGIPGKRGHRGQTGGRGSIGKKGIKGKYGFPGQKGRQGDRGKSGYSGERGAPGRRGEDGAVGPAGPIGRKGRKGAAGKKGYPGPSGARGPPGEEGPPGLRGQVGLPGTPGAYGKAGNPGPPGLPGKRGPQGVVGPNGARGETGRIGNEGAQGKRGKKGILGLAGDMGLPGQPGIQGSQGKPGDPGEMGVPGVSGSPGTQGDSGDVGSPGRRGIRGQSGTPGLDGKRGDMGHMGSPGKDGEDGEKGKPGKPGNPGIKGANGVPGVPGEKGEDGRYGKTGAVGSIGKDGDIGDIGETGSRGRPGPKGRMGTRGRIGPEGKTGEQGSMGHSSRKVGNPGPIGDEGAIGPRGPVGDPGRKGFKGPPGRKGPDGLKGSSGSPGANGESGNKGSTGRPGYMGSRGAKGGRGSRGGTGPAGYIGDDGNTGDEGFRGVKGQSGNIGPPGLKGPPGAPPIESLIPNARWRDYYTKNPTQFYQAVAGEYLTYISTEVDNIKYPPGTQSNPALNCKEIYDNKKYSKNGLKWIDPTRGCAWDAFEVFCNFTAKGESCLVNTTSMNIKSLRDANKGEILLSKYTKISYGISTPQLNFIRILSNYVWQEITLHCTSAVDHYDGIQLMGWNKKVFNAADKNRIEVKTNTCETATKARPGKIILRMYTEMDLTDIPIMDMAIKHRNIESVELGTTCFH